MEPRTLQEAILYFSKPENCREYLIARRWPNGIACPRCGSTNVLFLEKYNRWHCREKHNAPQFTLKTGTIFEDSPLGLDQWLTAMWMVVNCKNGVSSWEIHRTLKITQKSAWFMDHRIRLALQTGSLVKLGASGGEVEADEIFIRGKARTMHKSVRARRIKGQGFNVEDKTTVMGILERGGQVRAHVVPDPKKEALQPLVKTHVSSGTALFTDELVGDQGLQGEYEHQIVDHATRYVEGKVNVSVEPSHLFRYLDEQVFRLITVAAKPRLLAQIGLTLRSGKLWASA